MIVIIVVVVVCNNNNNNDSSSIRLYNILLIGHGGGLGGARDARPAEANHYMCIIIMDVQTYPKRFLPEPVALSKTQ